MCVFQKQNTEHLCYLYMVRPNEKTVLQKTRGIYTLFEKDCMSFVQEI